MEEAGQHLKFCRAPKTVIEDRNLKEKERKGGGHVCFVG